MIVSASRRTDIPALYLPWLSRRLQEGFCLVRNPHNPHRVSRVDLRPQAVDGMVLWTKNPIPLLQPAAQPGEVEGGDVRPAAGADDHCAPTSSTTRSSSRAMARKRRTTGEELLFK